MGIFSTKGRVHVPGFKHLSTEQSLLVLPSPELVRLPIVGPNGLEFEILVKTGDHVKIGTLIARRKDFPVPLYSPVSGEVENVEMRFHAGLGRPVKHLVIMNDKNDERETLMHLIVGENPTQTAIVEAIKEAGIIGMGGAGFPTYVKYLNCKEMDAILLNGIECEPYLTTDFLMMQSEQEWLLKGAEFLRLAANAKRIVIAIKRGKEAVKSALSGILPNYPLVKLVEVPDVYPMGWERSLVKEVFHKEYNKFPAEIGVVVNNVQTAAAVGRALCNGEIVTSRVLTVSGNAIDTNRNVRATIGTLASDVLTAVGGYQAGVEAVSLIAGGPMSSKAQLNDSFVITPVVNGLTVLKRVEWKAEPCLRCGDCTLACPAHLQPVEIKNAVEEKNTERIMTLDVNACVECGLCSYVCPSKIEVMEAVKKAKIQLKIAQAKANLGK